MNETIKKLPNEDFKVVKDNCVSCGVETMYNKTDNINRRAWYVEGAGQLCMGCYKGINK